MSGTRRLLPSFMEETEGAILLLNAAGEVLEGNAAGRRMTAARLLGEGERTRLADLLAEWVRQAQQGTLRHLCKLEDGGERSVEARLSPIRGRGAARWLLLLHDITSLTQTQEDLRRERSLLRTVIDNLPDGIYAKDRQGRKTLTNPADLRNAGLSDPAQALGKTDMEVFAPDFARQTHADDCAVMDSGAPLLRREEMLISPDGNKRWLLTSKIPVRNERGEVIGLVGIGRDITERKQIEQALRESEARLRAVFENSPIGILTTDTDGLVTAINTAYLRIIGGEGHADEIVGKVKMPELESMKRAKTQRLWRGLFERAKPFKVEMTFETTFGKPLTAAYSAAPLVDENGRVTGSVVCIEDLSEYYRARQTAETLRAVAEQRAAEAETLRLAGAAVASSLNTEEIIQRILEHLQRVIPYYSATVQLVRGEEVEVVGTHGVEAHVLLGRRFSIACGTPNAEIYRQKRPLLVKDPAGRYPTFDLPDYHSMAEWLGVPLIFQERVLGILALDSPLPGYFSEQRIRLACAFADQAAIALENARLYAEAQRSATEQSILNEISCSISSKLRLEELLEVVYAQVNRFIPARNFFVGRYDAADDEWYTVFAREERDPLVFLQRRYTSDEGVTGYIIQTRTPLLFNSDDDYQAHLERTGRPFIGIVPKSWMGVPLIASDRVVGVMVTQNYERDNFYSSQDFNFFKTIAAQIAVAFENAHLFARMEELADTDGLTGIYNRRKFFAEAEKEVERALRYCRALAVIMFDLDHFKQVNDRYGHAEGDRVLRAVTRCCSEILRKTDLFGRYGGEEFVILLPEIEGEEAVCVAGRLRQQIAAMKIPTPQGEVHVTASFGVAVLGGKCQTLDALLVNADQAMLQAKRLGRNRVQVYTPGVSADDADGSQMVR